MSVISVTMHRVFFATIAINWRDVFRTSSWQAAAVVRQLTLEFRGFLPTVPVVAQPGCTTLGEVRLGLAWLRPNAPILREATPRRHHPARDFTKTRERQLAIDEVGGKGKADCRPSVPKRWRYHATLVEDWLRLVT
jgi:hypothetical protein